MERRLGRGLGSLLSGPTAGERPTELPLDALRPNPYQPRRSFDPAALEELAQSLRRHGLLQPVVVRQTGEGYELISGERRWRAARRAGLERIPVLVREADDDAMLELALVENVQRQDLNPLEKALGYRDLMTTLELTQEEVAAKVGLQRSTVANHVRLLELPEPAQEALARGALGMGHARALLGAADPRACLALLAATIEEDLSVRELERRVRAFKEAPAERPAHVPTPQVPWARDMEARLRERLGARVTIASTGDYRGSFTIAFAGRDDLERLYRLLAPARTV